MSTSTSRRIIGLIFAIAVIAGGGYWAVTLVYTELLSVKLLAPVFMIVVGVIWVYKDFFERT
jgi:hypothetical protein